ncbi:MAG: hypothetical protein FOGNACKC_06212 [Anaerolineae bacterium]|nr:hypothetical protein [Anaerolineae bacterium]
MVSIKQLCRNRRIAKFDVVTPILVPSFSSKGFPEITWLWNHLSPHLEGTALVSAYDVFHNHIPKRLDSPSLIFIDSGGYEARKNFDLSEIYNQEYIPREWNRETHLAALKQIETLSFLALVSFDNALVHEDLGTQITTAKALFSNYPDAATDILLKPKSGLIDTGDIKTNVLQLNEFNLVGVTEKELGASLLERLQTLTRLRLILNEANLDLPIHIFGCLDPLSIWLFFLCGADVFDGLSWLRFAFYENVPIYRHSWVFLSGYEGLTDQEAQLLCCKQNLDALNTQRIAMAKFAKDYDLSCLPVSVEMVENLMNSLDISFV